MIQLLNPIALLATSGILIPVVIHLWNVRTGRTLRIGSIALLKESSRQSARNLKITEWLLLAVRCLLLLVLAFMLAQPLWKQKTVSMQAKGWLLLEKNSMSTAYQHFSTQIDSLLQAGYEMHALTPGFPPLSLQDTTDTPDTADVKMNLSRWALLAGLSTAIPDTLPVSIIADRQLSQYYGTRWAVPFNIKWYIYTPDAAADLHLLTAYQTANDSIRLISVQSKEDGNTLVRQTYSPAREGDDFTMTIENGQPRIQLTGENTGNVVLDTATLKITILEDADSSGGDYVYAALTAIQSFTQRRFQIVRTQDPEMLRNKQDILFCLSEDSLEKKALALVKKSGLLFSYAAGEMEAQTTQLFPVGNRPVQPVMLYRHIVADSTMGNKVWQDGFGRTVLNVTVAPDSVRHYHFYSRLDPSWTNLVWSPDFVQWLMPLVLTPSPDLPPEEDNRLISLSQMQLPRGNADVFNGQTRESETVPLEHLCWLLAFALLVLERILAYRQKKIKYHD